MKRRNVEEADALFETIHTEGFPVLLDVLSELCSNIDDKVLKYDLNQGPDGLVIQKARSEGSRQLQRELTSWADKFKKRGDKASSNNL